MRDDLNIFPKLLAGILHVAICVAMVFAFDWSRPVLPFVPLAIKGTLVLEDSLKQAPPVVEQVIEPEPEAQIDNSEQLRTEAEERKRQADLQLERERIAREDAAERQRKLAEEKERKRREEAETERRRLAAERKRLDDIERQRVENERQRNDAERRRQLEQELQAEQNRIDAMNAGAQARYIYAIGQKIVRNWIPPASSVQGLKCVVSVRQLPGGEVVSVVIERCNGDEAVRRSVEAAVYKASPLPLPEDPNLFDRNLLFEFEPTE